MDFGAFIVFGLAAIATLALLPIVLVAFVRRHPLRRPLLGGLGLMAAFLLIVGLWIYKAYFLDEGLVEAAGNGDTAAVKSLLRRGANPDSVWEDGTPAITFARQNNHPEIVAVLKKAGAQEK